MTKYQKGIFLILILLIPVVIFLFLKSFGENKFDIPVFYENGVPHAFDNCQFGNSDQYYIEDTSVKGPGCFVFVEDDKGLQEVNNIKQRLKQSVDDLNVRIYTSDSLSAETNQVTLLSHNELVDKLRCVFASDTLEQFILIDKQKRVRGYYSFDRDEIDRLIVESKILFENERNIE